MIYDKEQSKKEVLQSFFILLRINRKLSDLSSKLNLLQNDEQQNNDLAVPHTEHQNDDRTCLS